MQVNFEAKHLKRLSIWIDDQGDVCAATHKNHLVLNMTILEFRNGSVAFVPKTRRGKAPVDELKLCSQNTEVFETQQIRRAYPLLVSTITDQQEAEVHHIACQQSGSCLLDMAGSSSRH